MELETLFHAGGGPAEMDGATKEKVQAYVVQRVGGFRCPDHDQQPTIICRGTTVENLSFEVKGCCQKVVYLVQRKLDE
jgi:hypothetical protein